MINTLENSPLPVVPDAIAKKAANRAKIAALGSKGRLAKSVVEKVNLDDETLLDDVTNAARDAVKSVANLTDAVKAACAADIDRDEVIEAVIAGGYSESGARSVVSAVYCGDNKRARAIGAGRKVSPAAMEIFKKALEFCSGDYDVTIKHLRSATNAAKSEKERIARASRVSVVQAAA